MKTLCISKKTNHVSVQLKNILQNYEIHQWYGIPHSALGEKKNAHTHTHKMQLSN